MTDKQEVKLIDIVQVGQDLEEFEVEFSMNVKPAKGKKAPEDNRPSLPVPAMKMEGAEQTATDEIKASQDTPVSLEWIQRMAEQVKKEPNQGILRKTKDSSIADGAIKSVKFDEEALRKIQSDPSPASKAAKLAFYARRRDKCLVKANA